MTNREYIKSLDNREFARVLAAVAGHEGNKEEVDFWEVWLQNEKVKMKEDRLTVTFDGSLGDEAGICVSREVNGRVDVLKMELGEQADILYRLLTEQTAKAEIKVEDELITKLMDIAGDFSIMLERTVSDAKQDDFKVNKFINRLDDFCNDAKRKIRGY